MRTSLQQYLALQKPQKAKALQMLGLNTGHKVKIQTAGKDFWDARAIEDWKWEVSESPPVTSQPRRKAVKWL